MIIYLQTIFVASGTKLTGISVNFVKIIDYCTHVQCILSIALIFRRWLFKHDSTNVIADFFAVVLEITFIFCNYLYSRL